MAGARFRKRLVEVDAVRWSGENVDEVRDFLGSRSGMVRPGLPVTLWDGDQRRQVDVPVGHWIVAPVVPGGEVYAASPGLFESVFELVGS